MEYSYTKKIDTCNDYGYLEFFIKNITFQLYSSHNYSSILHIIKSKESKEEVDVADCFMEFILFLYKLNIDWFYPKKINFIDYNNITITNKDIKTLLLLSEIALSNDRENKDYRFYNCVYHLCINQITSFHDMRELFAERIKRLMGVVSR